MKARPLENERRPDHPIPWRQPRGYFPHKVTDKETWGTVARQFSLPSPQYLIVYNFRVDVPVARVGGAASARHRKATAEVNWYLREYVGCNVSKDGGRNWAFSESADPGIIYIPTIDFEGDGTLILGYKGVGPTITVPQYDDSSYYDTISKALDIYGMADMAINVSEVPLPVWIEAGLIVTGTFASIVAPFVALGAGTAEALRSASRDHFFEGFSIGLVMSASGASDDYIKSRHHLNYPPANSSFPEKRETFRRLHNVGLTLGIKQGKRFNTVDKKAFFTYLHSHLAPYYQGQFNLLIPWDHWTEHQKRAYYDALSSMVKRYMLDNNLKLKIE